MNLRLKIFNVTLRQSFASLVTILPFLIFSQNIEGLKKELRDSQGLQKAQLQLQLSQAYLHRDEAKSIEYATDALAIAQNSKNQSLAANANFLLAKSYFRSKKYESALNYANRATDWFERNDAENDAILKELVGDILFAQGQFDTAISHFTAIISFYQSKKDYTSIGFLSTKIGSAYEKQHKFDKAIHWQDKAYENFRKGQDIKEMIRCRSILGGVYSNYGDYTSAKDALTEAIRLAEQNNLMDEFGQLKKRLSVVQSNFEKNKAGETLYEQNQSKEQQQELAEAHKQKAKSLEEIEQLSEEKQLVEYKIRVQQDEFEKKMLTERLEKLKIKEDLKQEKLAKENIQLALKNEKLISDRKSAENRELLITISLLALVLTLILLALILKQRSNRKLAQKNNEIAQQKTEIQTKQENINQSILYAKKLQEAILPPHDKIKKCFSDAFVYLNPKDNVSGDFIWSYQSKDAYYICAADCTGHGVPGAFMSITFNTLLDQTVKKESISDPAEILTRVEELLYHKIQEHQDDLSAFKDGMDAAVLRFNRDHTELSYSGARNGFVLVSGEHIEQFKGVRRSIEIALDDRPKPSFESKKVTVQKGDLIYLYSDGFPDQKGGEENTKYYRKRFNDLLLKIAPLELSTQKKELKRSFQEWKDHNEQVDDVLVVGLKI